jgi:hypothetical protein
LAKILVMIPSGEVYNHDCVRWYQYQEIQRFIDHYHNIGDAFVFDSSLKLLNYDQLDVLDIRTVKPGDVERYNAEYDYVFLRGSNYIHSDMDWENAEQVLPKLKIPILAFGVGAQAPKEGKLQLSEQSKRVWKTIADKSASLGVRGAYTAEVLWDLGIKNVWIIGCPTAFRNNDPDLRIDLPPLDQIKNVGFTMRREVSAAYAQDIETYLTRHRDVVKEMARRFDIVMMMQGEVEEKKLLWGTDEQKAHALAELKNNAWIAQWFLDEEMEELYKNRLWYSDVVADYEDLVRSKDLVLGYRLHGNLMALANRTPSIYFSYDSRTVEFAETFAIPCYDVFSQKPFVLEEYWDQARFERFNRTYYQRFRDMRAFLDENFIDHKMHDGVAKQRHLQVA